ncbi:MAG: rRNA maturation RNase YbeY [Planctomycetes bacterium]|nr:rRNA maturation RNase YbeY [Planctomycetota bacterium]
MPLTVTASASRPSDDPAAKRVARLLRRAGHLLNLAGELSVRVAGDEEVRDLHRRYLKDNSTTDVLTFDLRDDPQGPILSGDMIISADRAAVEARKRRVPVIDEMLTYALHGLLHLLGHDDATKDQARRMADETRRLFNILRGPPPWRSVLATGADLILYGLSDCPRCRQARRLTRRMNLAVEERDILRQPPTKVVLTEALRGREPVEALDPRHPAFAARGYDRNPPGKFATLGLMLAEPDLIHRPMIVARRGFSFGFDPKRIKEFLHARFPDKAAPASDDPPGE